MHTKPALWKGPPPLDRLDLNRSIWARLLAGEDPGHGPAAALYAPLIAAKAVVAQVGQSLDGRVATPSGDARDISGPDGLAHLHRLRALAQAVVIGVGTAVADDPLLTVRLVDGENPVRVVLDPRGRLPAAARMLHDGGPPVLALQGPDAPRRSDCETLSLACDSGFDPHAVVAALAGRGLNRLLIEGGAKTIGRFLAAGALDRLHVAVAPLIVGAGPAGIGLPAVGTLAEAIRPTVRVYDLGSDVLFDCALR